MFSHGTKPKNRNKRAKVQISQSTARTTGEKSVSLLKDDDLGIGEELPINVPQLSN